MRVAGLAAALALAVTGCGRQDLDLLTRTQQEDQCVGFITKDDCEAQARCSFQPNAEGCLSTDPNCRPGMCTQSDPFVHRVGRSFFLNGAPFRFVGVSSWALMEGTECTPTKPEDREARTQRAYDDLVASRTKVARFFAFQSNAGADGTDYTIFDASVRAARRAGVRLMLVLDHGDGACSVGGRRDTSWYAGGYKSQDGKYSLSYLEFATRLAEYYQDEPTVLGYVLLQSMGGADASTLTGFINAMGDMLRVTAPDQLISLDLNWDSGAAETYRSLQELPSVDLVDVDDYVLNQNPRPLDPTLLATLEQIDKPAVIGEGAFSLDGSDDAALKRRAQKAKNRIVEWHNAGFSGGLLWAYQPGWTDVSEEFDGRPNDPMLQPGGVIASAPW